MMSAKTRHRRRMALESLENRELMTIDLATSLATALVADSLSDDRYEPNDSRSQAAEIGSPTSSRTLSSLKMRDSQDWFCFRLNGRPSNGYVQIDFQHSRGDLDVRLFNASGSEVGSSTGTGNQERISLAGLPAGEYFVKVYGYRGEQNPHYSLTIRPGAAAATTPASTVIRPTTLAVNTTPSRFPGNARPLPGTSVIDVGSLPSTAPLPGQSMQNSTALSWSGIRANGVDLLNSILAPPPTTWASTAQDPLVQQFTVPRNPLMDNGLGYLPWTATSSLVHDVLRSDIAQHADLFSGNSWNTTMFGGTRPGIYYAVESYIANNFANGATAIDVSGINQAYGIGDGNLDLLAQVSHGAFGPQNPNRGVPIPLFRQWGWGAPIG